MYSSIQDLEYIIPHQELVNLTNDTPAQDINEDVANKAIETADEIINSYLRNKHKLPLKFTPNLIKTFSGDIAAYKLYSRRPRKLPEHIEKSYEQAIKFLKDIQAGKLILDLPAEHPGEDIQAPPSMIVTNKTRNSKLFNEDMMSQFRGS